MTPSQAVDVFVETYIKIFRRFTEVKDAGSLLAEAAKDYLRFTHEDSDMHEWQELKEALDAFIEIRDKKLT